MNRLKTIRVMVVDDHAVVRSSLAAFLMAYDDFQLVGEAKNGARAVELCAESCPDVLLMDLVMPVMDGILATRLIKEKHPCVQVIALTSFKDDEYVQGALSAGALGYLLKDISADELAEAIRAAAHGKATLANEAVQVLGGNTRSPGEACSH